MGTGGFTDVTITYATPRGDDLDTRLLRAMVIKGILEQITTATVNLVNADLLARNRGLRILESKVPSAGTVGPAACSYQHAPVGQTGFSPWRARSPRPAWWALPPVATSMPRWGRQSVHAHRTMLLPLQNIVRSASNVLPGW